MESATLEKIKQLPREQKERALMLAQEKKNRARYRNNSVDWMVERLGVRRETIDWRSIPGYEHHKWDGTVNPLMKISQSLDESQWVAVEGATGTQKTFHAACYALSFLDRFEDSLVVTVAPKEKQLELHIWQEIQQLFPRFGRGQLMKLNLKMNPPDDRWIMTGFVAGVKAEEVERALSASRGQGFHRKDMLIIFEETPGIAQAVMRAFTLTSVAPHNLILALGNPNYQMDTLHQFAKRPNVVHVTISGFDHPNVVLDNPEFIPGAQSRIGLQRILEEFGSVDNPMYLSRARGICPEQSQFALIKLEWLYAARDRWLQLMEPYLKKDGRTPDPELTRSMKDPWGLGVDVANSINGDKAAICYGRGNIVLEVPDFSCPNANQLGHDVARFMKERGVDVRRVGVDGVGVGAGTVNALLEHNLVVVNLIGGAKEDEEATKKEKTVEHFVNLRSQMYWQMAKDLRDGLIHLPHDEKLFAELVIPEASDKADKMIQVTPKDEIKTKLNGQSPNKSDALCYWNWVRKSRGVVAAMASEPKNTKKAGTHRERSMSVYDDISSMSDRKSVYDD